MPTQYRSDALRHTLANLHRQAPDVRGSALLMTSDGLIIASHPPGWDADIHDPTGGENVAAMAAVVVSTAERTMTRLELGSLERVLLEGENYIIAVIPVTHDASLAVLIAKDAKLGLTLQAARKTATELNGVLNTTN
jgi:predicted regulator of Ras-like GTPase activity (Roadblock/LC7/MglB family)